MGPQPCPPSVYPPAIYLQEVVEPKLRGKTNADLAAYVLELREALRQANADKRALKQFLDIS
ncbi:MAG: hypothetical protein LBO66_07795 [Deltaproteobacteria bacterium]|nr:hypothetical protein [Deltaproteobacteria bacterium]